MGVTTSEIDSQDTLKVLQDNRQSGRGVVQQWTAGVIVSLTMWTAGSSLGWSSPSVPQLEDGKGIDGLTKDEISWVASLLMLASIPGCFIGGYLSDKWGRRMMCIAGVLPYTLGWGLIAGAQNAWMLIVGRIILGICTGIYMVTSSVFCAEIAEDRLRSRLMAWNVVSLCLGILYTYIIGAIVSWRINTIICGATPLLHLIGILFIPETPRYLITKGNSEKASKALQWFRGAKSETDVQMELEKIVNDVKEENSNTLNAELSYEKIFVASTIKPVLISLTCGIFQQLSGTSAVTFYTVDIFESSGSDVEPNIAAIIYGTTQTIFTALAGVLMTRFGRKTLFFFSEIGMACSLAVLGLFYYLKENQPDSTKNLGWLPLATLVTYTITYCCGAGILPWTLMADLCPPHVKAIASALNAAINCGLGFLVTLVFPRLLDEIQGYGAFWLFSATCCVGALFVVFVLPETKDKTMDEIMNLFKKPRKNSV